MTTARSCGVAKGRSVRLSGVGASEEEGRGCRIFAHMLMGRFLASRVVRKPQEISRLEEENGCQLPILSSSPCLHLSLLNLVHLLHAYGILGQSGMTAIATSP